MGYAASILGKNDYVVGMAVTPKSVKMGEDA